MNYDSPRIIILDNSVSRKIAAGEVIDRPSSVLRELLDNAIDARASEIHCSIEQGGSSLIEVWENGVGMNAENLKLCCHSHATSKIQNEADLLQTRTLGFRGEALYSIAAVSKLAITSRNAGSELGAEIGIEGGGRAKITPKPIHKGTIVRIRDLFYNLPARKQFLRSQRAESSQCKTAFLEKASAHPNITFKFFVDSNPRIILPKLESRQFDNPNNHENNNGPNQENYQQRISDIYPDQCKNELLHTIQGSAEGFIANIVIGLPPLHRPDRKFIQIFCNGRRISDYSLVHAVEYAFSSLLPGGRYPIAFLFLNIDPSEIDFNIHPTKKEVRFRKPELIHQRIRQCIQNFVDFYARRKPSQIKSIDKLSPLSRQQSTNAPSTYLLAAESPAFTYRSSQKSRNPTFNKGNSPHFPNRESSNIPTESYIGKPQYKYLGQIFMLFFLVELEQSLLIIDMHAAHERILFDRYRASKISEQLLIPIVIHSEESEDRLKQICPVLNSIGFRCSHTAESDIEITAVPSAFSGKESALHNLISDLGKTSEDLETSIYASMACRTAIKDGDLLDTATAHSIIDQSLALPIKRCPHGRPIWFEITREELFQLLGRNL